MSRLSHCLWFDGKAEEAAKFYTGIFKGGKILNTARYGNEGKDIHGAESGTVMTVDFELNGMRYMALNGGPHFKFNEAFSIVVTCKDQVEVDYYWDRLVDGGSPSQCGWLKDKYGLSWQIVPEALGKLMASGDKTGADRVMKAFLNMQKFDIAALEKAYSGR